METVDQIVLAKRFIADNIARHEAEVNIARWTAVADLQEGSADIANLSGVRDTLNYALKDLEHVEKIKALQKRLNEVASVIDYFKIKTADPEFEYVMTEESEEVMRGLCVKQGYDLETIFKQGAQFFKRHINALDKFSRMDKDAYIFCADYFFSKQKPKLRTSVLQKSNSQSIS